MAIVGFVVILGSVPFAILALSFDPSIHPPPSPTPVERRASDRFSLPDVTGQYRGQYGIVTYSITSQAIVPNIPLNVTATVEIPVFLTVQWTNIAILVSPDNGVVNGWPTINGLRQAVILTSPSGERSSIINDAWTGSQVMNFTSEGLVGGQVEIIWQPSPDLWRYADWNDSTIKVRTLTSLAIESPLVEQSAYEQKVSNAWFTTYSNATLFAAFLAVGMPTLLWGLDATMKNQKRNNHPTQPFFGE